jgi:cyclophilin family peptidyl-prolyl cis-trans isomerase
LRKSPFLDNEHVVFGEVYSGKDTIYKMQKYGNSQKPQDLPSKRIYIEHCGEVPPEPDGDENFDTSNDEDQFHDEF